MDNLNTSKTSSQILLEAADLLEQEDRWNKGYFFKANKTNPEKGCSMCTHGAIMYCSNAEVRAAVNNNGAAAGGTVNISAALNTLGAAVNMGAGAEFYKNKAAEENLTLEQYLQKHFGSGCVAHYKAFKAGLEYAFNDAPGTTKEDVIAKLRTAANLKSDLQ